MSLHMLFYLQLGSSSKIGIIIPYRVPHKQCTFETFARETSHRFVSKMSKSFFKCLKKRKYFLLSNTIESYLDVVFCMSKLYKTKKLR